MVWLKTGAYPGIERQRTKSASYPNLAPEQHFTQLLAITDGFWFGCIKQDELHLEVAAVSTCVDSTGAR
jgi:hypothetical protein